MATQARLLAGKETTKPIEQSVILLSGGLDSTTLLHYLARRLGCTEIYALSFDYGQKHARELEAARRQAKAAGVREHHVVNMSGFGGLVRNASALTAPTIAVPDMAQLDPNTRGTPPTYVPNRNMVLLSMSAAYAETIGIPDIFYGAQRQDAYGYWDCTPEFLDKINALLALNRSLRPRVHAPFVDMSKTQVLELGMALGVEYAHTWTCYRGDATPCGTCPSCAERLAAFRAVGQTDPLQYKNE